MLLDSHSHRPVPYPEGIINASPGETLVSGQLYSIGIHPEEIPPQPEALLEKLAEQAASDPRIVAIGECGLDSLCHTPMWLQLKVFTAHARIASQLGKPLVIHSVRTINEVCNLRRTLRPDVPWVVHGFRGKPTLLNMLMQAGCHVSYGPRFNLLSLSLTPTAYLLAETDCSPLSIKEVIESLSRSAGRELTETIARNTAEVFTPQTL